VPAAAGSGQRVEGARRRTRGAIWAEEEGAWGRKKMGRSGGRRLLNGVWQGEDFGGGVDRVAAKGVHAMGEDVGGSVPD
jgi:hypothetical protein